MKSVEISVVSPIYMGEAFVDELVERIETTVSQITANYEIILVDDNGPDDSWQKIEALCKEKPFVIGIKLSRNYGQQYALQAGLDASSGDYVVTLDCDLQDRPEEIVTLLNKAKEGYHIVVASRQNRKDNFMKRYFSIAFYQVLSYLTETEQDASVANFAVFHRQVVNAMARVKDHKRYYPMLPFLVGFKYVKVAIEHAERPEGESSYSMKRRFNLALETILAFSDKPLRLSVKFGVVLSLLSISAAVIMVILYFFGDLRADGWASLALLISFLSGIIISVLGMVGLYVGQIFEAVKQRPTYIIQEKIN